MTPERVKYFTTISNEELIVRSEIQHKEHMIHMLKMCISDTTNQNVIRVFKTEMAEIKRVINVLRKQLPQKLVYDNERNHCGWNCPACRYRILNDLGFRLDPIRCHCPRCGQKMRWRYD